MGTAALAVACYLYCRPKIRLATLQQLRQEAPPELLLSPPADPAASVRYARLVECAKNVHVAPEGTSETDLGKLVQRAHANQPYLQEADHLLSEGPIQGHLKGDLARPPSPFRLLSRALAEKATIAGLGNDPKGCASAIHTNLALAHRLAKSGGSLTDYLIMVSVDKLGISSLTSCAQNGWLSRQDLKEMLREVPVETPGDPPLASAYAHDFQSLLVKLASTPMTVQDELYGGANKTTYWEGSFDALATAQLAGKVVGQQYQNALREWPDNDRSDRDFLASLSRGIPTDPAADGKPSSWLSETVYHLKMNLIPNSVGRSYATTWLFNDLARESSVYKACSHELARTVLAARLYSADHAGALPVSLDQLIKKGYLKQLPVDWFVCRPLRYNRRKGIVYSVGLDQQDDGGKFDRQGQTLQPDFGYFLTHPGRLDALSALVS